MKKIKILYFFISHKLLVWKAKGVHTISNVADSPFSFFNGGKFFSVCLRLTVEGARAKLYQIPSVAYFALL